MITHDVPGIRCVDRDSVTFNVSVHSHHGIAKNTAAVRRFKQSRCACRGSNFECVDLCLYP